MATGGAAVSLPMVVHRHIAGRHDPADLGAQLGVPLHVPAEDVDDADVHQVKVLGREGGLGTLAAALDSHDHVLSHVRTMTSTPCAVAGGAPRSRGRSAWRPRGWRSWAAASVPDNWPSGPATCWPPRSRRTGRARAAAGWSAGWPRPPARPATPRSAAPPPPGGPRPRSAPPAPETRNPAAVPAPPAPPPRSRPRSRTAGAARPPRQQRRRATR